MQLPHLAPPSKSSVECLRTGHFHKHETSESGVGKKGECLMRCCMEPETIKQAASSSALWRLWARKFCSGGNGGLCLVHCRVFSILGFYPIDFSSTIPPCDNKKCLQTLSNVSLRTKSLLAQNDSHRNTQPGSAICRRAIWRTSFPRGCFCPGLSAEPAVHSTRVSGGPASRQLQQRPAPYSQQHKKGLSPTARQIPHNVPSCQVGSNSLGSQNLTLFLGSACTHKNKTILNMTDFLAFHLQSLMH